MKFSSGISSSSTGQRQSGSQPEPSGSLTTGGSSVSLSGFVHGTSLAGVGQSSMHSTGMERGGFIQKNQITGFP